MSLVVGTRIRGVVDAMGSGGVNYASVGCVFVINLAAYWADGRLVQSTLRCEMPVAEDVLRQWMARVRAYSVVEAVIVGFADRNAVLISELEVTAEEDRELAAISEELQRPVVFQSRRFGALSLDRRGRCYQGVAQWCGTEVPLSISCAVLNDPASAVAVAESLFNDQDARNRRARDYAADRLLELKNDSWLDEDEVEISRAEFISRMQIASISINQNGDFHLWYEDGGLFFGHLILVSGNLERGLSDTGIHG
jgi:hypothetical protein